MLQFGNDGSKGLDWAVPSNRVILTGIHSTLTVFKTLPHHLTVLTDYYKNLKFSEFQTLIALKTYNSFK